MHKIEKGIPLPRQKSKYPFPAMEVGDSVFFEGERTTGAIYRAAYMYKTRSDGEFDFTARNVEGGMRLWRTA